ncbi:MAG: ABC transporter ATP-binding protein [Ruminococcaceae bacterium]|nr:ABC transporter ATP-binding protein [Oscillospiraceae bacterium]
MYIELKGIKKNYGKKQVLTDINLKAASGQCIGILGGNGSGKSTLFSILAGVNKHNGGSFSCDGNELFKNKKLRRDLVGYVPQGTPLFEELSAYDNLLLWYDKKEIEYQLSEGLLGILGLNTFLKTPVSKMSGGMKKRLAIGCSVANSPKILLLDEPSAALDLVCKERIANYLKSFKANGGIILLATHDAGELELCDEIYILKNGILTKFNYDGNVHRLVGSL